MKLGLRVNRWLFIFGVLLSLVGTIWLVKPAPAQAATGVNQTVSFQGRLLNSQGAIVPDGYYNIEFKIYQDGDGQSVGDTTPAGSPGSLKWTEDYLNENGKGVLVQNGYLSVQLGSITPFGSSINWNQSVLWLSMNIGGTGNTVGPSGSDPSAWDGEMVPMQPFTASPYALNSGLLGGLSSSQYIQLAQGVQADNSTASSIFINKTSGSGKVLELQNNNVDMFTVAYNGATTITGATPTSGNAADILTVVGGNGAGTATAGNGANISITAGNGGSGSTANGNGGNITLSAGAAGVGAGTAGVAGSVIVKNASNSTNAFTVKQSGVSGNQVLNVDTTNQTVQIGPASKVGNTGVLNLYSTTQNAINVQGENAQSQIFWKVAGNQSYYDAFLNAVRARGTLASPTALQAGDDIFTFNGVGQYSSSATIATAGMAFSADGNFSSTATPGRITFSTHANDSPTTDFNPIERLRIDSSGNVGIGTTQNSITTSAKLHVVSADAGTALLKITDASPTVTDVMTIADGGATTFKNVSNSTSAFQIQNSTNSQPVLAVDTTNNQLVLGAPGVSGLTGQIKLFYAGSTGSTTLVMQDPGTNNYQLTIPSGGGTICTTANGLCSGGGTGSGGLAKNAVDTSSADAVSGYLYTFTNTGNAETGGVLSLNNGNNTGPIEFLKGSSTTAFQVQNSAGYNTLVLDNSSNPAHLKIYDGTATQAYADISYNDSSSSAVYTASAGTAQFGGGSVPTLLTAGSGQAVNITGHTDSSWALDNGNLTIDVTGTTPTMNIGTGAQAKTVNIGNQTGATAINIKGGSGNINLIPVGTGNTGVVVKSTNASTAAFQVQNSSTSKLVMSVDTSGNQVVIGDGSASGITGQLAFSYSGASGKILLKPSASPGASTFTLQLPAENGTICTTAASAACVSAYGGGTSGSNFLAKNATDTSSADSGGGYLYGFTNAGSGGSGGVLSLNNGNNTGSTLAATTSGNPSAGKAVIYAANTNATPSGNLIDLEAGSTPTSVFSVDTTGKVTAAGTSIDGAALTFGGASAATIQPATSQALTITGHASSTWSLDAGDLTIQTAAASSNLTLDSGAGGTIAVGGINAGTINIGNLALATGTQTINIGTNNTSGGTTNVVIGAGGSASGGTTTIQSKGNTVIATNGVNRATFDTSGNLYLGNGTSSATPANFTIRGTDSTTDGTAGSTVTIQGGNATVGNANGGNVSITGGAGIGTGVSGLVMLSTPTFATIVADPNCYTGGAPVTNSCTIAQTSVDGSASVIVGFSTEGQVATLPAPTISTPGRVIYITAANGTKDFTLAVNGGSGVGNEIAMRQNTSATMIWNGAAWTAAGASSSTTLQAAYDNTLQSAGGAELVVSHTSATNGLTIRDSSVNPVNGTLVSVQTNSAATILAVNGNVTEYASDAGAETAGDTVSTFPANSWSAVGAATVSRYTTVGNFVDTGEGSVSVATTTAAGDGVANQLSTALTANLHYNVSFAARLASGTFTDMNVYYSVDGSQTSVDCADNQAVTSSIWTKVNCTFAAPASGITTGNAMLIRQNGGGTARTFYIDNLSVTIAADFNYATDGGVDDDANFSTNWTAVGGDTVSRNTIYGNDASDSAEADTSASGQGVRNKLAIDPMNDTLYRVTVYAASSDSAFNSFTVQYSPDGGTTFVGCADYNTQTISSSVTDFTEVTCYINTDGNTVTTPYVYFTQGDNVTRSFYVDTFSMTLNTSGTPNVQIGGGVNGGPVTLLTLDRAASAPIASNNDAFLGSMYYDTSLGELQCYEADGWGSCGSSPNTVVTISPEYTNAVMHGTGVGTMTSDICSSTLGINDGSNGQPTICGANETFNFYKWTSPQASAQTYSIYVTYQLPDTFKTFASGQTSLMGRTDSNDATVQYEVYREDPDTGLTQCGPTVAVSTGVAGSWATGTASGASDPSTCGFNPDDSVVFKIDVISSQDADAYVGNLNFIFSHK